MRAQRPMASWAFPLALMGVVAAFAAAGTRPPAGAATTPTIRCASIEPRHGDEILTIATADGPRTARLHVPAKAIGHRVALVIAFHGANGTGRFMEGYSGLTAPALEGRTVELFPDGLAGHWNLVDEGHPDDVAFVRALVAAAEMHACIDPRRVSVVGVSNGGGFAAHLACALDGSLAAAVVVAGGFSRVPECDTDDPVSVLEIHGLSDPVVPYGGKVGTAHAGAVLPWVERWVHQDDCRPGPVHRRIAVRTLRYDWTGCAHGTAVAHIAIRGGGHQWPGATPPDPGPPSTFSAARVALAFIAGRRSAG